jgi:hypothetical protein
MGSIFNAAAIIDLVASRVFLEGGVAATTQLPLSCHDVSFLYNPP